MTNWPPDETWGQPRPTGMDYALDLHDRFLDALSTVSREASARVSGRRTPTGPTGSTRPRVRPMSPDRGASRYASARDGASQDALQALVSAGFDLLDDLVHMPGDLIARSVRPTRGAHGDAVAVLTLAALPGHTAVADIVVESVDGRPRARLQLECTDLIGDDGGRIDSSSVSFELSPPESYDPRDRYEPRDLLFRVVVTVPTDTAVGSYGGLIRARDLAGARLVLDLRVG